MPSSDPACAALGIPDYLHQLGREPDRDFDDEEFLFVRCRPQDTEIKNVISFRRQSCNRAKYCENGPDDVLYDSEQGGKHQEYIGVMAITVAEICAVTAGLPGQEGRGQLALSRSYTLHPTHRPDRCNYPHTEIIAHCNGVEDLENIKPNSVRKRLREMLVERYRFVLPLARAGERLNSQ